MENHVEHPVQASLDFPLLANGLAEALGIRGQAGQVVARLAQVPDSLPPDGLDAHDRLPAGPLALGVEACHELAPPKDRIASAFEPPRVLLEGARLVVDVRLPGLRR